VFLILLQGHYCLVAKSCAAASKGHRSRCTTNGADRPHNFRPSCICRYWLSDKATLYLHLQWYQYLTTRRHQSYDPAEEELSLSFFLRPSWDFPFPTSTPGRTVLLPVAAVVRLNPDLLGSTQYVPPTCSQPRHQPCLQLRHPRVPLSTFCTYLVPRFI